jgi:hypothetical protein
MSEPRECPDCRGTGLDNPYEENPADDARECDTCAGIGELEED